MDNELIERLRDECGMHPDTVGMDSVDVTENLCRFAAMVAEECAQAVLAARAQPTEGMVYAVEAVAAIRAVFKGPT
jgi:hypothetical protein